MSPLANAFNSSAKSLHGSLVLGKHLVATTSDGILRRLHKCQTLLRLRKNISPSNQRRREFRHVRLRSLKALLTCASWSSRDRLLLAQTPAFLPSSSPECAFIKVLLASASRSSSDCLIAGAVRAPPTSVCRHSRRPQRRTLQDEQPQRRSCCGCLTQRPLRTTQSPPVRSDLQKKSCPQWHSYSWRHGSRWRHCRSILAVMVSCGGRDLGLVKLPFREALDASTSAAASDVTLVCKSCNKPTTVSSSSSRCCTSSASCRSSSSLCATERLHRQAQPLPVPRVAGQLPT